jgi:hypothetical protein
MKFNRQAPGHYVAIAEKVEIKKGIGVNKDKWFCYFPDGKVSYRRSYEAAKAWSEKYIGQPQTKTQSKPKKPPQTKQFQPTPKKSQPSLKTLLQQNLSCVRGVEPLGCFNSGRAAAIVHLSVNDKSFYVVGYDECIEDTIFGIRKNLCAGIVDNSYEANSHTYLIFENFSKAEKAYRSMDNKMRERNLADLKVIKEAKEKAKQIDIEAMFTLGDYGVL